MRNDYFYAHRLANHRCSHLGDRLGRRIDHDAAGRRNLRLAVARHGVNCANHDDDGAGLDGGGALTTYCHLVASCFGPTEAGPSNCDP